MTDCIITNTGPYEDLGKRHDVVGEKPADRPLLGSLIRGRSVPRGPRGSRQRAERADLGGPSCPSPPLGIGLGPSGSHAPGLGGSLRRKWLTCNQGQGRWSEGPGREGFGWRESSPRRLSGLTGHSSAPRKDGPLGGKVPLRSGTQWGLGPGTQGVCGAGSRSLRPSPPWAAEGGARAPGRGLRWLRAHSWGRHPGADQIPCTSLCRGHPVTQAQPLVLGRRDLGMHTEVTGNPACTGTAAVPRGPPKSAGICFLGPYTPQGPCTSGHGRTSGAPMEAFPHLSAQTEGTSVTRGGGHEHQVAWLHLIQVSHLPETWPREDCRGL